MADHVNSLLENIKLFNKQYSISPADARPQTVGFGAADEDKSKASADKLRAESTRFRDGEERWWHKHLKHVDTFFRALDKGPTEKLFDKQLQIETRFGMETFRLVGAAHRGFAYGGKRGFVRTRVERNDMGEGGIFKVDIYREDTERRWVGYFIANVGTERNSLVSDSRIYINPIWTRHARRDENGVSIGEAVYAAIGEHLPAEITEWESHITHSHTLRNLAEETLAVAKKWKPTFGISTQLGVDIGLLTWQLARFMRDKRFGREVMKRVFSPSRLSKTTPGKLQRAAGFTNPKIEVRGYEDFINIRAIPTKLIMRTTRPLSTALSGFATQDNSRADDQLAQTKEVHKNSSGFGVEAVNRNDMLATLAHDLARSEGSAMVTENVSSLLKALSRKMERGVEFGFSTDLTDFSTVLVSDPETLAAMLSLRKENAALGKTFRQIQRAVLLGFKTWTPEQVKAFRKIKSENPELEFLEDITQAVKDLGYHEAVLPLVHPDFLTREVRDDLITVQKKIGYRFEFFLQNVISELVQDMVALYHISIAA